MKKECYEEEVKPYRKTDYKPMIYIDAYISQVTVDHGLQLWDLWSRSPDCDIVSVTNPLDRGSWPWHMSYVIVEQ